MLERAVNRAIPEKGTHGRHFQYVKGTVNVSQLSNVFYLSLILKDTLSEPPYEWQFIMSTIIIIITIPTVSHYYNHYYHHHHHYYYHNYHQQNYYCYCHSHYHHYLMFIITLIIVILSLLLALSLYSSSSRLPMQEEPDYLMIIPALFPRFSLQYKSGSAHIIRMEVSSHTKR